MKKDKEDSETCCSTDSGSCSGKPLKTILAVVQVVLLIIIVFQLSALTKNIGNVLSAGNDAAAPKPSAPQPAAPKIDMAKLVDDDPFLGPKDAKVVVIEFSDFQCPYCGAAMGTADALISRFKSQDPSWEPSVPKLKELAQKGKLKLVFRDFPLSFHPNARPAAIAANCAAKQGKFWEFHDALFEAQDTLSETVYTQIATEQKLDLAKWNECRKDPAVDQEISKDMADGGAAGVQGTPAFFVNGQFISGAQPFKAFEGALGLSG